MMKIISDLHLHSKYSRATSKQLDIKNLEKWARVKGLNLLGTSDFTHPEWIKELKNDLTEDETGILKTKTGMPFILQTEVSLIYTDQGKGRRVHNVILAPNFDVVNQITEYFLKHGRIDYDGRPIFKIPCPEMTESLMQINKDIEIIPAHCLLPDSFIHTSNGLKEIKNITKKDLVLTHKGNFKKVKKVLKRKYLGKVMQLVPACLKVGSYFTPEHPVYSIKTYKSCKNVPHTICKPTCTYLKRGCKKREFEKYRAEWSQIKDLEKGDIILYPRYNQIKDKSFIYLNDFVSGFFKEGKYLKPRKGKSYLKNISINNKVEVSEKFCRLIGYYLAEGYCTRDYIAFTFSEKEDEYIEDVRKLLVDIFGPYLNIQTIKEKSKGIIIRAHSKILKEFFEIFYTGKPYRSYNKKMPDWFIDLPENKLKQIIIGWWRGDAGCSISLNLFNQFKLIFIKLGIIPSIKMISAESTNNRRKTKSNKIDRRDIIAKNNAFYFHNLSFFKEDYGLRKSPEFKKFMTKLERRKGWIDKNYIYLPVIRINKKDYKGYVYNLEVNEDNSYLTENLAVHNCWTPWFGLLGSMSGFDSVEQAFKDQTKNIHALETGLSSDPSMNWRLSSLDKFSLISCSDSHSFWPWRIGREATIFNLNELTYKNIINALRTKQGLTGTIEVDPGYGKYHIDGHRNCNIALEPDESKKLNNICPVCKRPLTIGVLHRVEDLADRPQGFKPKDAKEFYSLIPISEILAKIMNSGIATKKIWEEYNKLIKAFETEINILLNAPEEELKKITDEKIAEKIIANRQGKIKIQPGYDGEYGYPVFSENDIKEKPKIGIKQIKQPQKGLNDFI